MKHPPIHVYNLIAFLGVLVSIVILAWNGKGTDLAIMTGLVGVLGSFKPWGMQAPADGQKVEIDQPANKPVPVETSE
jgi:hypothetical protein